MTQAGRPARSELDVVIAGALVVDPIDRRRQGRHRDQGRPDRRRRAGRATPRSATGSTSPSGRTPQPIMGYGLIATPGAVDSHVHAISPELLPAALSGGVTTLITRRLRGAAVGDGADARCGWRRGRSTSASRRAPGPRTTARSTPLLDAGAIGFKIHEDYGAYPELIDHVAAVRRRARRRRLAPHRRPARVGRARGHGRRDRRPDGPRLPRRGDRRRPRAGPARTRPRAEHPLLVDDADAAVRGQRRGRARPDDRPQPRRLARRCRTTSSWSANASTRRRWPPRARSTSSARSGSSTPTRRGWAGSWRRSAGRSSSPMS